MSCYLYDNWMTDNLMLETDFQRISEARAALNGWSDARVRQVARYLCRIAKLSQTSKWAMVVENRLPHLYIAKLTHSQLLAVNILRLAAKGLNDEDDEAVKADRARCEEEYTRLLEIQSRQRGRQAAYKEVEPKLDKADRYGKHQAKNASRKRGKGGTGDDSRTMGDLIATLARTHPNMKPREIWPHLKSAIEDWAGSCEEKTRRHMSVYEYPFDDGRKTISFNHFGERLREARKKKSTV
ncbi:MAG: hypothetical protein P4L96_13495 [Rhodoferax sp.]|nr:hypothetical protein [Rhodoferax sp.]